jgi:hypothetical protein
MAVLMQHGSAPVPHLEQLWAQLLQRGNGSINVALFEICPDLLTAPGSPWTRLLHNRNAF